ncbi:MAG: DUF2493 domain-containing protein, partial [Desulfovibrionales bacterium]
MKIAIIGSRSFNDFEFLSKTLRSTQDIELVISGGARGTDSLAERWAKENDIPTLIFTPDWKRFGRSAGVIRNKDIIDNCDVVYAFWDGQSKGTKSSIEYAKKK